MQTEIINYIIKNKEKHYRMAYSYVKNKDDALDIVQDTIVKALKYQDNLQNLDYIGTWFCRILINTCKTHLQKHHHYIPLEESNLEILSSSFQEDHTKLELDELIDQLSHNEKTIILLRYVQDFELKEIALVMEQNLSTVKSTLYRTIKKLRLMLEPEIRSENHD